VFARFRTHHLQGGKIGLLRLERLVQRLLDKADAAFKLACGRSLARGVFSQRRGMPPVPKEIAEGQPSDERHRDPGGDAEPALA